MGLLLYASQQSISYLSLTGITKDTFTNRQSGKRNLNTDPKCNVLHLSTCTNEPSGEDLCARWLVVIKSVGKGMDLEL